MKPKSKAGHKGQPAAVQKKGRLGRQRRLKTKAGRGTLAKEKPPIFAMIQRSGEVVRQMRIFRQASNDRTCNPKHDCAWYSDLHGRI